MTSNQTQPASIIQSASYSPDRIMADRLDQTNPSSPSGFAPGYDGYARDRYTTETPLTEPATPVYSYADYPEVLAPQPTNSDIYGATPMGNTPSLGASATTTTQSQSNGNSPADPSWGRRLGSKAAAPIHGLAHIVGAESFLPTTMNKECEKAARILRSFCKDGIYSEDATSNDAIQTHPPVPMSTTMPTKSSAAKGGSSKPRDPTKSRSKAHVLLKIPSKVIAQAQGLAIFTMVRAGFHFTGESGSGIVVSRLPDGSWSPPSGIQVHSVGAGFVMGLDLYDCVVVLNTRAALRAFTKTKISLGSDLAITAGPWGAGGALDWRLPTPSSRGMARDADLVPELPLQRARDNDAAYSPAAPSPSSSQSQLPSTEHLKDTSLATGSQRSPGSRKANTSRLRDAISPVYSYVKSRGFYVGFGFDGTVVTERKDANARFYGERLSVEQILRGQPHHLQSTTAWQSSAATLARILKGAEGGWRGASQTDGIPPSDVPAVVADQPAPVVPNWKAAEAAREAQASRTADEAGALPSYSERGDALRDLPPPYGEADQSRRGSEDDKTNLI